MIILIISNIDFVTSDKRIKLKAREMLKKTRI